MADNSHGSYYFLEEDSKKGIIAPDGKWVVPIDNNYSDVSMAGSIYVKVARNGNYGLLTLYGQEIIPLSRGYTSIDDYNSTMGTFAFTKRGIKGVCNMQGKEISTTRLAPTADDIKEMGNYDNVEAVKDEGKTYFIVKKNYRYGLTDAEGRVIIPVELGYLSEAGTGFLRFQVGSYYGIMNYNAKVIIPTDRGYTSIGNYISVTKRFPYTMDGYKGECNHLGQQISKIKVAKPVVTPTPETPKKEVIKREDPPQIQEEKKIIIEHDPVPVQQWQACFACGGMGTMGCDNCGGSGTKYIGNSLYTCSRCNGRGIIPCNMCHGNKGQYVTVYR